MSMNTLCTNRNKKYITLSNMKFNTIYECDKGKLWEMISYVETPDSVYVVLNTNRFDYYKFVLTDKFELVSTDNTIVIKSLFETEIEKTNDSLNENKNCVEHDIVNSPKHYKIADGVEVKDVVKIILDRWDSECEISSYAGGCMKEALQYLLRAPLKNGEEDVKKAVWYLNEWLSVEQ